MPFNGSGTFNRLMNWVGDATANIKIRADRHDQEDDNLAGGLSNAICRDGQSIVVADIPFNGHKLTNVGNPVDAQDVVTRGFLDSFGGWTTSKFISGADANGRLNFTSPTGVNGITWSSIDASWVAKKADSSGQKERDRVVLNNSASTAGTDVFAIDDNDGALQFPSQFQAYTNLIYDGVSYRTPAAGTGGVLRKTATALSMLANSVVTTLAYGVATLETWFSVVRSGGTVLVTLNKKAATDYAGIMGQKDGVLRWLMQFGTGLAEAADNSGSAFALTAYKNDGSTAYSVMSAFRNTGKVSFPQGHTGTLSLDNHLTFETNGVVEASGTMVLAAGVNTIYLRPRGASIGTNQATYTINGDLIIDRYLIANGIAECAGTGASPNAGQLFNFNYVDSTHINVYVGTSIVGHIVPGASLDYDALFADIAALKAAVQDAQARIAALEAA